MSLNGGPAVQPRHVYLTDRWLANCRVVSAPPSSCAHPLRDPAWPWLGAEPTLTAGRLHGHSPLDDDRRCVMSDLLVVGYDDKNQADEVRLRLIKMQRDYLVDLADAVVAVRQADGKVELHQVHNLTAAGALRGGVWGALVGLLVVRPLLGFAVGAA